MAGRPALERRERPIRPERHMDEMLAFKYGPAESRGWGPRLRERFGYSRPGDWYEAMLFALVGPETEWLDIGCGRNVLPIDPDGARHLASRCRRLVGVDPSENVMENPLLHERAQCQIEEYQSASQFDLVTMRMVAEHIADPISLMQCLSRLVRPGGHVLLYTVARFSPAAVAAAVTPMAVHHGVKRLLWRSEQRDTFRVAYRMNTRGALRRLFTTADFVEEDFRYLDDCCALAQWKWPSVVELAIWKAFHTFRIPYPERNIVALFRKRS
jgi:SAM-dependent methyltransferase